MRWLARWSAGAAFFVLASILVACDRDGDARVLVAAASDLRFAFEELEEPFEARCECDLVFSFGSSGLLSNQIEQGLDVDVFASADTAYVDGLEQKALLRDGTRQLYAVGRIVLALPASSSLQATSLEHLLQPGFRRIAIANPEHAPYGRAAKQALEHAGVWAALQGRLVLGENASLATQFVETANAEAGIVPLSLAIQREGLLRYALVDDSLHEPLMQVAAVTRSSGNSEQAVAFLDFLGSPEGREVMRRFGFLLPGETFDQ